MFAGPFHPIWRQAAILSILAPLLMAAALLNLSCAQRGNAGEAERDALLQAVRNYWYTGRDYSVGFTTGVGDMRYAEVQGDEAEVRVEIVLGYRQPTEGAGYKETTFRLHRTEGSWEVIYDGWLGREVGGSS
jgi:hypothetical protein